MSCTPGFRGRREESSPPLRFAFRRVRTQDFSKENLFTLASDKDSSLDQTEVSLLHLLPGPSVHFFIKYSFSKNPAESVYPDALPLVTDRHRYLIGSLDLHHSQGRSDHVACLRQASSELR